jgi:hypothetical protein
VKNLRENIFLAVRGSYLPFVEGVGGSDAHGDTKVGKGNADAKESLLGKALGRLYGKQLAPILLAPQFGPDVLNRLPTVNIGGIDWETVKTVSDTVATIAEKFPARVSISQKWLGQSLGIPPAIDPDDEANVQQQPPADGGPGGGGNPPEPDDKGGPATGEIAGGPEAPEMPPGSSTDGPAPAAPPKTIPPAPTSNFSADQATSYAAHFEPNQHGHYPGTIHEEYGLTPGQFAAVNNLRRREVGKGEGRRWVWVPRPELEADRTFSDAPRVAGSVEAAEWLDRTLEAVCGPTT